MTLVPAYTRPLGPPRGHPPGLQRTQSCLSPLPGAAMPTRSPSLPDTDDDQESHPHRDDDIDQDGDIDDDIDDGFYYPTSARSTSASATPPPWWPFHRQRRSLAAAAGHYSRLPQNPDLFARSPTPSSSSTTSSVANDANDGEKLPLYRRRHSSSASHRSRRPHLTPRSLQRPSSLGLCRRLYSRLHAHHAFRRYMGPIFAAAVLIALVLWFVSYQVIRPPPYNLVPPRDYHKVLREFAAEQQLLPPPPRGVKTPPLAPWSISLETQLLALKTRMEARAKSAQCTGSYSTQLTEHPIESDQPTAPANIPSMMYSSDHIPPPDAEMSRWKQNWVALGFDPVFLGEDAANAFVDENFGSLTHTLPSLSQDATAPSAATHTAAEQQQQEAYAKLSDQTQSATQKAWYALPRGVLRADFLRYVLLLARGGTWADMDVTPIGHRSTWTAPHARWVPERKSEGTSPAGKGRNLFPKTCPANGSSTSSSSSQPAEPIRLVVGLECEPWEYMSHSARAWFERAHLLPMNRHREVQFTQWVLHGGPGHPVLVDVLRRLLLADKLYDAYQVESSSQLRLEVTTDGAPVPRPRTDIHPWTNIHAARRWVPPSAASRLLAEPAWEQDMPRSGWRYWALWPWMWSWPRWGWHPLSVEEWSGPAVWTDAVFSYLYAVAGVRPRDLYGLDQPVQVADVLIAPGSWFNPPRSSLSRAKVLHIFRGSWKHGADTVGRKR